MNRRVAPVARRLLELLPAIAALVAGVVLWEVWVRWRDTPSYLLPPPSTIWAAFVADRDLLGEHVLATLGEAMLGLAVGAVLGVALAVVIAGSALARRVLYPIVVASQTVPMIIMAPLLVLWFGFGLTPKVMVVAMVTFFPVAIATVGGLTSADPDLVDLLRSMGATRGQILTNVLIPNALPALFDGLRIAAAYTIAGAVIAEWTGASRGLGIYINRSQASFRVDQVFVAVTIVALLSTALFLIIGGLARAASPWRYVSPASGRTFSDHSTVSNQRSTKEKDSQ
ncbi:MAG: ABC transporter permease [Acidimicrobiales bacterium]